MPDTLFMMETNVSKKLRLSGETLYRKELIYSGDFEKQNEKFNIGEKDIDNWLLNFSKMQELGIELPLQLEHNESPEATRGKIVGLEKGINEAGDVALFGYLSFRDEEAEKMSKTAQVSIYSVANFTDGKGNEYKNCLRHVALTIEPVIPGLDSFQEIAASLACEKRKPEMSRMNELAKKLDLSLSDGSTEDLTFDAILEYVGKLNTELSAVKAALKPPFKKEEDDPEADPEMKKKKTEEDMQKASLAASFAKIEGKSRDLQVDSLLSSGRITKVVADDLKKSYCGKDLALSFTSGGDFKDGFDTLMLTLAKNDKVLSFTENSGMQTSTDTDNPLIADAEARAKAN